VSPCRGRRDDTYTKQLLHGVVVLAEGFRESRPGVFKVGPSVERNCYNLSYMPRFAEEAFAGDATSA